MKPADGKPRKVIPIAAAPGDKPKTETTSLYEAQKKVYPRSISGMFANWRWIMVYVTQLIFYGLPWLQWGERQMVLFDFRHPTVLHVRVGFVSARFYLFNRPAYYFRLGIVFVYSGCREAVVRIFMPTNGLYRNIHVARAQDRR